MHKTRGGGGKRRESKHIIQMKPHSCERGFFLLRFVCWLGGRECFVWFRLPSFPIPHQSFHTLSVNMLASVLVGRSVGSACGGEEEGMHVTCCLLACCMHEYAFSPCMIIVAKIAQRINEDHGGIRSAIVAILFYLMFL